jgi:hypothetical protein
MVVLMQILGMVAFLGIVVGMLYLTYRLFKKIKAKKQVHKEVQEAIVETKVENPTWEEVDHQRTIKKEEGSIFDKYM